MKSFFKWTGISLFLLFTNSALFITFCHYWEIPGKKTNALTHYDVAIVLGGMSEYNNDLKTLSMRRGADRIWQAIDLYHQGKVKKILISGDNGDLVNKGLHEAQQFSEVLIRWGIPKSDLLIETKSRNTYENAVESKKILDQHPELKTKLLVTSGTHMKRSLACFSKQNIKCSSFSTDLYSGKKNKIYWNQYIFPNHHILTEWDKLIKEWIGYGAYKMAGYI